jgi:branched-chain amino acid transport system substrate-binding protein
MCFQVGNTLEFYNEERSIEMMGRSKALSCSVFSFGLTVLVLVLPAVAQDTLKIGVMYSLTGPAAGVAKTQKNATELAIKELNEAGGIQIAGKKLKLEEVFCDDHSKAETATELFEDLVKKQGVTAVVGGTLAHIPIAVNIAAKKNPALYIATCAVPDAFYKAEEKAPTTLGILGGASDVGRTGAAYVAEKMKPRKIACFMPAYAFGNALASGFESVMKKYPDINYKVFWHPLGSSDMKRDLEAVRDYKPDAIVIGSFGKDASNALTQAFLMGLGKNAKLFHLWFLDSFAVALPPEAMKGVWAQMFWYHDMAGFQDETLAQRTNEFVARYAKAYGEPPDSFSVPAYFSVKEVARAIELAQSTDPAKMYEALMANPVWTSAKGEGRWRKDGRCIYKYFVFIVEGKGPGERQNGTFGAKYDFGRIVDAISGENTIPTPKEIGY